PDLPYSDCWVQLSALPPIGPRLMTLKFVAISSRSSVVIKSQATTSLSAPTESPGPFEDTDEDGGELWSPPTACPASVEHDAALVASSPAATVVTSTCRVRTEFTIKLYSLTS